MCGVKLTDTVACKTAIFISRSEALFVYGTLKRGFFNHTRRVERSFCLRLLKTYIIKT